MFNDEPFNILCNEQTGDEQGEPKEPEENLEN